MENPPQPTEEAQAPPPQAPAPVRHFVFCCRMCRAALFTDGEVLQHSSSKSAKGNKGFSWRHGRSGEGDDDDEGDSQGVEGGLPDTCTSYFLDPDVTPWVSEESRPLAAAAEGQQLESLPDTIYCRNDRCHAKIGAQSWIGAQCSCGAWITPAFRILAKTVDRLPAELPGEAQ